MSLQVWLPLNGNFNNQGIGKVTITGGTPTFKTTGKIGEQGIDLKTQVIFSCPALANLSTFTIAFWAKAESSSTLTGTWVDLFGFSSKNTSGSTGNFRWETCYSGSSLGIHWHNNTVNALTSSSANHISKKDTWVHCCVVFDQEKGKLYSYNNGSFFYSAKHLGGTINGSGQFYFGQTNKIEGIINDLRIYDHALSADEVKEIAQGLILHYPLNDRYIEPTTNLWNFTTYSSYPDTINIYNANSTNTYIYGSWETAFTPYGNNIVSFSMDIENNTNSNCYLETRTRNASGTWKSYVNMASSTTVLAGESRRITVTFDGASDTDGKSFSFKVQFNKALNTFSPAESITISNVQVEAKDHSTPWVQEGKTRIPIIYDTSGYNHNGTVLGDLSLVEQSPIFDCSTEFNGSTSGILIENLQLSNILNEEVSYSFWIKPIGENGARSVYFGSYAGTSWSVEKTKANLLRLWWNGSPDLTCTDATITDGIWQHICITKKGTNDIKVYINGIQKYTDTTTHNALSFPTTYRIGRDTRSDGTAYHGDMADFRIYCTALSAEQVQALYNKSMMIDNNNKVSRSLEQEVVE